MIYPWECCMYTWKNVFSVAFEWNVLCISFKSIWPNVSFKADVFLLILSGWSICLCDYGLELPYSYYNVCFPFRSVNTWVICLGAPILSEHIFTVVISSYHIVPFFVSYFWLEVCLKYNYSIFFWFPLVWCIFYPSLTLCVSSLQKWVFCRQHIRGSYFLSLHHFVF